MQSPTPDAVYAESGKLVAELSGEFAPQWTPVIRELCDRATYEHCSALVLDVRRVTHLNSSGIGAIVGCARDGVRIILRAPTEAVRRRIERMGLIGIVEVESS